MSFYVKTIKFFDRFIITIICLIIGIPVKLFGFFKKKPEEVRNILFIKVWAIGDTVNFLPLIDSVKNKYPKAKIWALAKNRNKDVFKSTRLLDKLLLFEKGHYKRLFSMFRKFDIVIDGEPYLGISALIAFYLGKFRIGYGKQIRSLLYHKSSPYNREKHVVKGYLDFAAILDGKTDYEKLIKLDKISDADKRAVNNLLRRNKVKTLVGFCIGAAESATVSRMWPMDRFAYLAELILKDKKKHIVIIGSPGERKYIEEMISNIKTKRVINSAGLSLKQSFYLISRCKVFISNDTGPMHVAAAQGVRTIGLFGPNTPVLWGPYGRRNISIYKPGLDCQPCIRNDKGYMPDCKNALCIKKVTVQDVYKAYRRILNS